MKYHYYPFLILAVSMLLLSCATGAQGGASLSTPSGSGYTGFEDVDYLKVALDERKLDSVEDYLQALEDNKSLLPEYDQSRRGDVEYSAAYSAYKRLHDVREVVLIGELADAFPSAPQLKDLLLRRFELSRVVWNLDIRPEVEAYAKKYSDAEEKVKQAWYWYSNSIIVKNYRKPEPIRTALEHFKKRYPGSEELLELYQKAVRYLSGTDAQAEITKEMEKEFPDSEEVRQAKKLAEREAEKKKLLGKPFELRFKDRLSGQLIDTADLRGKVLVIDFWATWCGPCVAEVPKMKALYEQYHDRGVEFIGISLDRKISTLVEFCKKKGMTWPQYCEAGKTWETELSQKWMINAVPTIYIVDKRGKLYALDGRGKVEQYLNELL